MRHQGSLQLSAQLRSALLRQLSGRRAVAVIALHRAKLRQPGVDEAAALRLLALLPVFTGRLLKRMAPVVLPVAMNGSGRAACHNGWPGSYLMLMCASQVVLPVEMNDRSQDCTRWLLQWLG